MQPHPSQLSFVNILYSYEQVQDRIKAAISDELKHLGINCDDDIVRIFSPVQVRNIIIRGIYKHQRESGKSHGEIVTDLSVENGLQPDTIEAILKHKR